jgi:hypothetical protein
MTLGVRDFTRTLALRPISRTFGRRLRRPSDEEETFTITRGGMVFPQFSPEASEVKAIILRKS